MDKTVISILACPKCKGKVIYNDASNRIICDACNLEFPVKNDVPVMLLNEARSIRK